MLSRRIILILGWIPGGIKAFGWIQESDRGSQIRCMSLGRRREPVPGNAGGPGRSAQRRAPSRTCPLEVGPAKFRHQDVRVDTRRGHRAVQPGHDARRLAPGRR